MATVRGKKRRGLGLEEELQGQEIRNNRVPRGHWWLENVFTDSSGPAWA